MLYKYAYRSSLNYIDVESKIKNLLSKYKFIEEIDYDGEYINVFIDNKLKETAKLKEVDLNSTIKDFRG